MGSMQFLLPRRHEIADLATRCGYLVGHDGTPWDSRITCRGKRLILESESRESGRLVTPWPIQGHGVFALATSTLSQRPKPYILALELFRGTLHRVLEYEAYIASMTPDAQSDPELDQVRSCFVAAALSQGDEERTAEASEQGLGLCMSIMQRQLAALRPSSDNPDDYATRFTGFHVGDKTPAEKVEKLKLPGNSLSFAPNWRELEPNPNEWQWDETRAKVARLSKLGKRTVCGPLFCLEQKQLPDWLYLWEDDFDTIQSYVMSFVRAAATELDSTTHLWYACSGTNVDQELKLNEEQRLRLTLSILEALSRIAPQTPTLVGIKQPWGDYMGRGSWDLSPWQFADILVRSEVALTGFAIEIDLMCDGNHSMPRDLLEIERQLDLWASFGKPLVMVLTAETAHDDEPKAEKWLSYLRDMISVIDKKQYVQGIFWRPLIDSETRSTGVIDRRGNPKPILKELHRLWGG